MMQANQRLRSTIQLTAVTVLFALATTLAYGANPNPRIAPIDSNPYGNSYGEWSARWMQWFFSIPQGTNPALDPTGAFCAQGQTGKVWFLAGSLLNGSFTRTCTVPPGTALFLPITNGVFGAAVFDCDPTNPGVPCDVTTLRAAADAAMDPKNLDLKASIDGVPIGNLLDYRVQSPVFAVTLPNDNIVGIPSGTYSPMVSDGYWLLIAPLPPGNHTIHFSSTITGGPFNGSQTDVTYDLTVGR